eukprot:SAG31_NODE_7838_length_1585_cov_1.514805_1_plen_82_part_10
MNESDIGSMPLSSTPPYAAAYAFTPSVSSNRKRCGVTDACHTSIKRPKKRDQRLIIDLSLLNASSISIFRTCTAGAGISLFF